MRESIFLTELGAAVHHAGGVWYKIPDPTVDEIHRGARRRPYDAYAIFPGRFIALEAKVVIPGEYLYPLPHQLGSLREVASFGHDAILAVRVERQDGTALCARALTVSEYDDWRTAHDRQAIPWRELPRLGTDIPRLHGVPGVVWDIRGLLGPVAEQQAVITGSG